jgi:tRNA A37 threonylcarbamoyladenosine dehydratase
VHGVEEFAEPGNWPALLPRRVDAVIDACDEVKAKVALAAWALASRTLFITAGAAGGKRLAHKVDIDDLALTTHDPLLAQLRYRLRKFHGAPREGKRIGVPCVFSREAVAPPDPSCAIDDADGSLNCHGYGSVVASPPPSASARPAGCSTSSCAETHPRRRYNRGLCCKRNVSSTRRVGR